MAKGVFDKHELNPACPECGARVSLTVGEARKSPTRRCPNGHEIDFKAADFDREIRKVERQIDRFSK